MKVNCDNCSKDFNIKAKIKKYKGGVEELYFTCPHCKSKYTSYFTDKEIRKEQRRIKEKLEIINSEEYKDDILIQNQIDELKVSLKTNMDTLKKKYS